MSGTTLAALVNDVDARSPDLVSATLADDGPTITAITQDSRDVSRGALFCAVRGGASDGHAYVDDAIARGAAAVLVEQPTTAAVPELIASNARRATGYLAAAFEGHPSEHLDLIGVTGTNGKTSIVTLVAHLVESAGRVGASMGTLTGSLTTSAGPQFQSALRRHLDVGCAVVAAEVSSHALDQDRIAGSRVRVAVFSNLSQDHLDYHSDMESYFEAKTRLFSPDLAMAAVIDVSDPWGARLSEMVEIPVKKVDAAAIARSARLGQAHSEFEWRGHAVRLPIGGRFSVKNAVLAAEACCVIGLDPKDIATGLATAPQIPGRFESIDAGQPFGVVVDYSHTPASVEAAIASAHDLTDGRVIIVFGAAGDRDPGKRPLMGAAARHADVVFVTSDNPRTEDPEQIIDAVMAGVDDPSAKRLVHRAEAIEAAITEARPRDVVLIAGKGHEDYQIIGTTRRHFDDREVARSVLAALGWGVAT